MLTVKSSVKSMEVCRNNEKKKAIDESSVEVSGANDTSGVYKISMVRMS